MLGGAESHCSIHMYVCTICMYVPAYVHKLPCMCQSRLLFSLSFLITYSRESQGEPSSRQRGGRKYEDLLKPINLVWKVFLEQFANVVQSTLTSIAFPLKEKKSHQSEKGLSNVTTFTATTTTYPIINIGQILVERGKAFIWCT